MIAAIAAIVLFVSMFFAWYSAPGISDEQRERAEEAIELAEESGVEVPQGARDALDADAPSANAWESFDFTDLILMLAILAALALAAIAATSTQVNLPVAMSALVTGLGALATLLVLYRLIDPPADGIDRAFGIFIGLIAAGGIAYGGWRAMEEEGTSFGDQADRFGGP
ncbi:MAG TPA: hypothetical protein VD766_13110, partial [Solirubrobacterales bacterium]|nr:hypothetical protein [Solirubrobacterales bacterium]